MTEAEWLTRADPDALVALPRTPRTARKQKCLGAAYCRLLWPLLAEDELLRRGFEAIETGLDSEEQGNDPDSEELWREVSVAAGRWEGGPPWFKRAAAQMLLAWADPEYVAAILFDCFKAWEAPERLSVRLAHVRREVIGNPFRPVSFPPEWRTGTAVALARQMYESHDFGAMPILADALRNAGCDNADVLDHCREPGHHVRGCWVVDLVLGKE